MWHIKKLYQEAVAIIQEIGRLRHLGLTGRLSAQAMRSRVKFQKENQGENNG